MRARYKNGDTVGLQANGCDGCSPSRVCDVLVHEKGCPEAWRDDGKRCPDCGCKFHTKFAQEVICMACRVANS